MRVNYAQVNTPGSGSSATDRTWVEAGGAQVAPAWSYWTQYYAGPMYAVTTNWFDVPQNGQVNVMWASGSQVPASQYSGATVRSYEYRRYEPGATPTWVPLRFPGQYADAETGLFENWNRFYDPSTGRYTATDPELRRPGTRLPEVYGYAANNPLSKVDPTGLANMDGDHVDRRNATLVKTSTGEKKKLAAAMVLALVWGWTAGEAIAYVTGTAAGAATMTAVAAASTKADRAGNAVASVSEKVELFRAVLQAELNDINATGAFSNPYGVEVKYFSRTPDGASQYAQMACRGFGTGPFTLVQTTLSADSIGPEMIANVDPNQAGRTIPTVTVPTEMLPQLSTPIVHQSMPIP